MFVYIDNTYSVKSCSSLCHILIMKSLYYVLLRLLLTIPTDCCTTYQRYGEDCSKDCSRCVGDCSKTNGSCAKCVDGYTDPHHGCNTECPPMTYGYNCIGKCLIKCREDCIERMFGTCAEDSSSLDYVFTIASIPLCCALFLLLMAKWGAINNKDKQRGSSTETNQSTATELE